MKKKKKYIKGKREYKASFILGILGTIVSCLGLLGGISIFLGGIGKLLINSSEDAGFKGRHRKAARRLCSFATWLSIAEIVFYMMLSEFA